MFQDMTSHNFIHRVVRPRVGEHIKIMDDIRNAGYTVYIDVALAIVGATSEVGDASSPHNLLWFQPQSHKVNP